MSNPKGGHYDDTSILGPYKALLIFFGDGQMNVAHQKG
jgi:hypothetical protein